MGWKFTSVLFKLSSNVCYSVYRLQVTLLLRIPGWITTASTTVTVQDSANRTTSLTGTRGSYLKVLIHDGGSVSATFTLGLRLSVYNGTELSPVPSADTCCNSGNASGSNNAPSGENRTRAALEFGPILLAAVASEYASNNPANCSSAGDPLSDITDLSLAGAFTIQGIDVMEDLPATWLHQSDTALGEYSVSFDVRDNPCVSFVPYFEVQFDEMTVYPAFQPQKSAGPPPVQLCSIVTDNFPQMTAAVCVSCPLGQAINSITLAEFGLITGDCSSKRFHVNESCRADPGNVSQFVASHCLGAVSCTVTADDRHFGADPCKGFHKQLAVVVTCGTQQCGIADETKSVTVGCGANATISAVLGAEFGSIIGHCPGFSIDPTHTCRSDPGTVRSVVQGRCLGKNSCTVPATMQLFGKDPCRGIPKRLAVAVACRHA